VKSKKRILLAVACVACLLLTMVIVILCSGALDRSRPAVRLVGYTNVYGTRMALFVVSNSTLQPINFSTSPDYSRDSATMPFFMPLSPGQTNLVTVALQASQRAVKFEFVAQTPYLRALVLALQGSGLRGAIKVTKDNFSGVTRFRRRPEYDLEIRLEQ
jgi:hypothetical protein